MFSQNTLKSRRSKVSQNLDQNLADGDVVLFYSGRPVQKPGGQDQHYDFLPFPDYFWLTGLRRPGGILAYQKGEGWTDFVEPISLSERLWEGGGEEPQGLPVQDFENWFSKHATGSTYRLGVGFETPLEIQERVNEVRRIKDEEDLKWVARAAECAAAGFKAVQDFIKPGVSERDIQLTYEFAVLKAGAEKFPYSTLVGAGRNASVLHALPSSYVLGENDMVLMDAGADLHDYCVDITRMFSSSGQLTEQQQAVYDVVRKAQSECIAMCTPGTEWFDIHAKANAVVVEGLKSFGILKDSASQAAGALFLPHGIGHMVGLKVRDVGAVITKEKRTLNGVAPRVDMPLGENFLMTVEPGLYFVEALLNEKRKEFEDQVHWAELEKWRAIGGVRLEDDILVKSGEPENLTATVPHLFEG